MKFNIKTWGLMCLFAILLLNISFAETFIYHYNQTVTNGNSVVGGAGYAKQQINAANESLNKICFEMKYQTSNNNNFIYFHLYSDGGNQIDTKLQDLNITYNSSNLTTSYQLICNNFNTISNLVNNSRYWIVINASKIAANTLILQHNSAGQSEYCDDGGGNLNSATRNTYCYRGKVIYNSSITFESNPINIKTQNIVTTYWNTPTINLTWNVTSAQNGTMTLYRNGLVNQTIFYQPIGYNFTQITNTFLIYDNLSYELYLRNGTYGLSQNSSTIQILPPLVYYINILNTTTYFKQNLTCNYSILNGNNTIIDWLVNGSLAKINNDSFIESDYLNEYLGKSITCRINSTVISKSYTAYNTSNGLIVGQNITFLARVIYNLSYISGFNISYSLGNFYTASNNLTIFNYNVTEEYAFFSTNYEISKVNLSSSKNSTYTFLVYDAQSVNFSFYDSKTFALLNDRNVTINIYSTTTNTYYNYSTATGNLYVSLLASLTYQIQSKTKDYQDNYLTLTISPNTYQSKNVYMVNSTTKVTYTIIDQSTKAQQGITIKMLKYDSILLAWVYIQECTTNDAGQCSFYVVEPDTYRYSLFSNDGSLLLFVSNELVDYSSRIFVVSTSDTTFENFDLCKETQDNTYYLAWGINNTYNFTVRNTWNNNQISKVCMKLYKQNNTQTSLFDECLTYSNQNQVYKYNQQLDNVTYVFEIYSVINGKTCNINYGYIKLSKEQNIYGKWGYLITFMLIMFLACIGILLKSPEMTTVLALIGLTACSILNFISLSYLALFGLWFLVGIYIYVRNKQ